MAELVLNLLEGGGVRAFKNGEVRTKQLRRMADAYQGLDPSPFTTKAVDKRPLPAPNNKPGNFLYCLKLYLT